MSTTNQLTFVDWSGPNGEAFVRDLVAEHLPEVDLDNGQDYVDTTEGGVYLWWESKWRDETVVPFAETLTRDRPGLVIEWQENWDDDDEGQRLTRFTNGESEEVHEWSKDYIVNGTHAAMVELEQACTQWDQLFPTTDMNVLIFRGQELAERAKALLELLRT